jgi:hypothetical protein
VIRDRQAEHARVALDHPDEHVRAAAAFAWLHHRGDPAVIATLRAVATDVGEPTARRVLRLAAAHGALHVGATALRGSYELNPGRLAELVERVEGKTARADGVIA